MKASFTRLYQDELSHLREMGEEFAREHPKIASRLGLGSLEVADPYVERLLEGFAFLAARVRLKIDAEQPRLIAQLLESTYPNFLAPVPSMMVVRLVVDTNDPNLAQGYPVPRGSVVQSTLPRGQDTLCEYRTASALQLWPIELLNVEYFSHAPDLGLARWPAAEAARAGLRIRLRAGGGLTFKQLKLERLPLFISAPDDVAFRLHELLLGAPLATLLAPLPATPTAAEPPEAQHTRATALAHSWRASHSIQPLGLGADEALLPESLRTFSGHRLVQELAALPQRFLFFEVTDLQARLQGVDSAEVDLIVLLKKADPSLQALVDRSSLALHCTPAINLFLKRLGQVALEPGASEHHVVPDRTRPMDYEVHSLHRVTGYGSGVAGQQSFKPLYSWQQNSTSLGADLGTHLGTDLGKDGGSDHSAGQDAGYYTLRREERQQSENQRRQGARVPSYLGGEVFLSLTDPGHGPYRDTLRQLSVQAWVSNRDLPVLLPQGHPARTEGAPTWKLETPGPVTDVHCMRGPTRPVSRLPTGRVGWQLVSQLANNHVALGDDGRANAARLRELLLLYGPAHDPVWQQQAEGIVSLKAQQVVRRLPIKGPASFGNGVELTLEVDEQAFHGSSAFLMASVLDVFFKRHAAINSFTQLKLTSVQRGTVMQWPTRSGLGATL